MVARAPPPVLGRSNAPSSGKKARGILIFALILSSMTLLASNFHLAQYASRDATGSSFNELNPLTHLTGFIRGQRREEDSVENSDNNNNLRGAHHESEAKESEAKESEAKESEADSLENESSSEDSVENSDNNNNLRGAHHESEAKESEAKESEAKESGAKESEAKAASLPSLDATLNTTQKSAEKHATGLICPGMSSPTDASSVQELAYWEDIEADETFLTPYAASPASQTSDAPEAKYITFESDRGGWNNIRMSMETILAVALLTGRTLVIPPPEGMYIPYQDNENKENNKLSFEDFFDLKAMADEVEGFNFISMEEFLTKEGLTGNLARVDDETGQLTGTILKPPQNGTVDWSNIRKKGDLYYYLREVGYVRHMDFYKSYMVIPKDPSKSSHSDMQYLTEGHSSHMVKNASAVTFAEKVAIAEEFYGNPVPVNASAKERMREFYDGRQTMHVYDSVMQDSKVLHFPASGTKIKDKEGSRLLTHFYTFLFFEDDKIDRWVKRVMRDHVRYKDEIYCIAAKIISLMHEFSLKHDPGGKGDFDTLHVRRGDFQRAFKEAIVDNTTLYEHTKDYLTTGGTLFIATDERDKEYFAPMKEHYNVFFLDDFMDLPALKEINSNFYGMIDQIIASRGKVFSGTWFSTFTGYINRMRGYHQERAAAASKGNEVHDGIINSYYFGKQLSKVNEMREYKPIVFPFYVREFPVSWRGINFDVRKIL